ncbi:MAG: hypothetical protein ABTQ73_02290 [Caldilineales bacterium]
MLETGVDIALIFLTLQALVLLVFVVILTALMAKATAVVRSKVQSFTPVVQEKSQQLADITDTASHKVAEPFIRLDARRARAEAMVKQAVTPAAATFASKPLSEE